MSPQNVNEVYNFVNKFLNLRNNGNNATLSMQSQDRGIIINLQLHIPSCPPPRYQSYPPPHPSQSRSRPSPSRVRRSSRRANARAEKAVNDALLHETTEQVAADSSTSTIKTAAGTTCDPNDEAGQALETPSKLLHHPLCPAEEAVPVSEQVRPQPQNQAVDHDQQKQQCIKPPQGRNQQQQSDDVLTEKDESEPEPVHTVMQDDLAKIMKDLTNNLTTDGLAESIREAVRDALKPP